MRYNASNKLKGYRRMVRFYRPFLMLGFQFQKLRWIHSFVMSFKWHGYIQVFKREDSNLKDANNYCFTINHSTIVAFANAKKYTPTFYLFLNLGFFSCIWCYDFLICFCVCYIEETIWFEKFIYVIHYSWFVLTNSNKVCIFLLFCGPF